MAGAGAALRGLDVSRIRAGTKKYGACESVPAELIGHSKGLRQILLERKLVGLEEVKQIKSRCEKEKKTQGEGLVGAPLQSVAEGESVEAPVHSCTGHTTCTGATCCCLHYLLAQEDDFKNQENAVKEYVKKRGRHCIFLPKFHPGEPPPALSICLFK